MKFLKFKHKKKIYLFEESNKEDLISKIINEVKKDFKFNEIELMSSNLFKIKNNKNEELENLFNH
jgi:hypothetical protein